MWIVENPAILVDSKTLDSSLQEKYVSHLLSGKSLPITTKCLSCTMHTIVSTNQTIAIARGFSRLDAVFVSLYNSTQAGTKQINTYFHPMGNSNAFCCNHKALYCYLIVRFWLRRKSIEWYLRCMFRNYALWIWSRLVWGALKLVKRPEKAGLN